MRHLLKNLCTCITSPTFATLVLKRSAQDGQSGTSAFHCRLRGLSVDLCLVRLLPRVCGRPSSENPRRRKRTPRHPRHRQNCSAHLPFILSASNDLWLPPQKVYSNFKMSKEEIQTVSDVFKTVDDGRRIYKFNFSTLLVGKYLHGSRKRFFFFSNALRPRCLRGRC